MRRETKKGWCVCVCVCLCAEEARFHEVTISLSVERATGVGRERVLGVILSLVEDAFGPRHSCQTTSVIPTRVDSPAANFRKRRIP